MNVANSYQSLELVRGTALTGSTKQNAPWYQDAFIQSVEFDNYGGQTHNASGNLLGVDFEAMAGGGQIYSFATRRKLCSRGATDR